MASLCWFHLPTGSLVLAADASAGEGLRQFLFLFVPLFAIWYFLVIMPQSRQRKRTQEMLSNLKTGDRVLTSGGIYGTIVGFRDNVVQLQVANQVKIDVARSAITGMQSSQTDANTGNGKESQRETAGKGKN